jgi:flotillin
MIQEARGAVLALVAQAKAEITRQKARALQVERQLLADVIQPQDAATRSAEEAARGKAATIVENGKAEAEALRRLVEEYKKAGGRAREVLVFQQMMPLVGDIAGAGQTVKIKQLTVLPSGGGDAGLARRVISASEQIRAATGVDVASVLHRLGGSEPPPLPPAKKG